MCSNTSSCLFVCSFQVHYFLLFDSTFPRYGFPDHLWPGGNPCILILGDAEAQRGGAICLRTHSREAVEPEFAPQVLTFESRVPSPFPMALRHCWILMLLLLTIYHTHIWCLIYPGAALPISHAGIVLKTTLRVRELPPFDRGENRGSESTGPVQSHLASRGRAGIQALQPRV